MTEQDKAATDAGKNTDGAAELEESALDKAAGGMVNRRRLPNDPGGTNDDSI